MPSGAKSLVAFVVPQPGVTLDLQAAGRVLPGSTSPASSGPSATNSSTRLPKNNYGKVLKTELRQRLQIPYA